MNQGSKDAYWVLLEKMGLTTVFFLKQRMEY